VHVEGIERRPLMGRGGGFGGIKLVCFKDWFRGFPVSTSLRLDFDVRGRTFHLAVVGGMHWYVVMKPTAQRKGGIKGHSEKTTAMEMSRSGRLCKFVLQRMMGYRLMHVGYNERNYKEGRNRDLTSIDFRALQEEMMGKWEEGMVGDENTDEFWMTHKPTFHCICIGPNLGVSGA
jgi:hypothetical protein